jgi:hypothetical protein
MLRSIIPAMTASLPKASVPETRIAAIRQKTAVAVHALIRSPWTWAALFVGLTGWPLLLPAFRGPSMDPVNAGQFGDFYGGVFGTIASFGSFLLLVHVFRSDRREARQDTFESRYYELVKLHRENVSEMRLEENEARKVFVSLIREFRALLEIVGESADATGVSLSKKQRIIVAHNALFYGSGRNSTRQLEAALADYEPRFVAALDTAMASKQRRKDAVKRHSIHHTPFEGHQSRLGHYFRHLYQTLRYIDRNAHLTDGEKYEYAKTVRAQLSTHEQALLLLNSLCPLGENWWSEELITRYRMVQNIPRDFFNTVEELDVKKLIHWPYFEWESGVTGVGQPGTQGDIG